MQKMKIFTPGRILGIMLGVVVLLFVSRMGGSVSAYQAVPTPTAATAPATAQTHAVSLTLNETYVNALVKQQLLDNPNVYDPVVDLRAPNQALVTMSMRVAGGLTVRPTATIAFVVSNNRIVVDIVRVDVGSLNVPRVLIQNQLLALQTELENQLNQLTHPLNSSILQLENISANDTELTVEMGFKPQSGLVPKTGSDASGTSFPIVSATPADILRNLNRRAAALMQLPAGSLAQMGSQDDPSMPLLNQIFIKPQQSPNEPCPCLYVTMKSGR